jgi:16S rRNA (uracil1498-N3)-methyltransferase
VNLFFSDKIRAHIAELSADETRHLAQVLRRKVGDNVQLTDGQGNLYTGDILEIGKKSALITIKTTQAAYQECPFRLHIGIAPTKNMDRFEWFLEKTTEIGIDSITPLLCTRSERTVVKTDRLRGILLSAMKQSLKTYLPKLNELLDFQKFIKSDFSGYQKFIAHCADDSEKRPLSMAYQKGQNVLILIGPEGDFTEGEVQAAVRQNFETISLGKARLRTETAGIVACHSINFINE